MPATTRDGQVGAVVGQNPDGTPKMADAKTAKLSDLVKFNKNQNPIEAFISTFIRQAQNPSLFGFFKLPADRYDAIAPAMADLIQDPASNGEMLKPYEVEVKPVAQTQEQTRHRNRPRRKYSRNRKQSLSLNRKVCRPVRK